MTPHRCSTLTPRLGAVLEGLRVGWRWNQNDGHGTYQKGWVSTSELAMETSAHHIDVRDCIHELRALGYPIEARWASRKRRDYDDPWTREKLRYRIYRLSRSACRRMGLPLFVAKTPRGRESQRKRIQDARDGIQL